MQRNVGSNNGTDVLSGNTTTSSSNGNNANGNMLGSSSPSASSGITINNNKGGAMPPTNTAILSDNDDLLDQAAGGFALISEALIPESTSNAYVGLTNKQHSNLVALQQQQHNNHHHTHQHHHISADGTTSNVVGTMMSNTTININGNGGGGGGITSSSAGANNNSNNNNKDNNKGGDDLWDDDCDSNGKKFTNAYLAKELCKLVGPTVLMSVIGFGTQGITVAFVGRRLGPDALASFGIGNSVFNLFGISIGYGLTAALDTLVSQSFGRHKQDSAEIGEYIQRATLINIILTFVVGFIFVYGEPVFSLMFGHEMGSGAAEYTRYAVPYLFLYLVAATFIKVFQAIDEPRIPFYATLASTICCIFFNYYFLHSSFVAAASVMAATYFVQCIVLIGFCFMHPKITFWKHCKWPATKAVLNKQLMKEYFVVGIPSLLACAIEWWAFEVLQMIAASISVHVIAVLNITLSVSGLLFSVCTGMSTAAGVKVGNALGEGKPILAQRYARLAIYVDQVINCFTVSMMIIFRYQIGGLFTTDADLINTFAFMAFVLAVYHWGDSTQMAYQGVFRGAGQQSQLVAAIVLSLWLVGLPLSYLFGSVFNGGAAGIMSGLIGGFAVEIPILYRYTTQWSWPQLAIEASAGGGLISMH